MTYLDRRLIELLFRMGNRGWKRCQASAREAWNAAWNRRSGEGERELKLAIEEECRRCVEEKGIGRMYHDLHFEIEQVRDEIRDRPMRFGVKYRVKDELNLIVDTLTRILGDDDTETDKFKRKTKPVTTRIGKD